MMIMGNQNIMKKNCKIGISWCSPKIESKDSNVSGKGVFAKETVRKGELVAVFGGFIIHMNQLDTLEKESPDSFQTILEVGYQIDDELIISPISRDQFSHIEYLNHSCDANCGFVDQLHLVAIRNIEKGEELHMDYATCITSEIFEMPCNCGASMCRKTLSAHDWQNTEVQNKYFEYFQPFIKKKIINTKV